MKVIGYVRVSTEGQAQDGVSLEAQEAKVRAWAELNVAERVEMFRDAGLSGKRADNRPGLQAALAAIRAGDALVVYSLSRLARSTKDTILLSEQLGRKGADLVSLSEKIDTTTAAGKMVFRMLAVLSEFERDQVAERTRHALAHKRANGQKTGGDVPFGFRCMDGLLVEDEREQDVIHQIRAMRQESHSLREIAAELAQRGVPTKTGRPTWNPKTIAAILERTGAAA